MSSATPRRWSDAMLCQFVVQGWSVVEGHLPVLDPSSKIRQVMGPSLKVSPAWMGTKLTRSSGMGIEEAMILELRLAQVYGKGEDAGGLGRVGCGCLVCLKWDEVIFPRKWDGGAEPINVYRFMPDLCKL